MMKRNHFSLLHLMRKLLKTVVSKITHGDIITEIHVTYCIFFLQVSTWIAWVVSFVLLMFQCVLACLGYLTHQSNATSTQS